MVELRLLGTVGLVGVDDAVANALLRRPQRVALLAYLATATRDGYERRDRLLAMFWPEQDDERARHCLRQALHGLRNSLGRSLFINRGEHEVAVDPTVLRCDLAEVERLLASGDAAGALRRHRGELLPGFFISGAPDFERWLETTRDRLRTSCTAAALQLAAETEIRGDMAAAVAWARRAQSLSPTDEVALRRLLELLGRAGDRSGALNVHRQFVRRLALDLDVEPAAATQALASQLRGPAPKSDVGLTSADATAVPFAAEPVPFPTQATDIAPPPPRHRRFTRASVISAALVLATVTLAVTAVRARPSAAPAASDTPSGHPAVARRLYEEGRGAWMDQDNAAAERLMRAALAEDSTFALAMLHLGHLMGIQGRHVEAQRVQARAARLALTQTDHERLRVLAWYAENYSDPRFLALADTLAIRYPDDLEGQLLVAHARRQSGDLLGAIEPLRRVIALDTLLERDAAAPDCPGCRAYRDLVDVLENTDSLAAAEQAARAWTTRRPREGVAWEALSYELAIQDRYTEALAARQRASDLRGSAADPIAVVEILLRAGDFRTIEHIVGVSIANGSLEQASNARFSQWQSLREQGRMREALGVTRAMYTMTRREPGLGGLATVMRAQSLYETGDFVGSAGVWASVADGAANGNTPASAARIRTMALSHSADALAALHDTLALVRLADSVRAEGARSGSARDHRMHFHVRGLLLALRGRASDACDAFHRSLYTASAAYIRANLALGRSCIAAQRSADAIGPLRGVLRGPTGAAGTYGTHTEAHELIARAFDALGQRDSARVHYARVAAAWSVADEPWRARADSARVRLAALGGAPRPSPAIAGLTRALASRRF